MTRRIDIDEMYRFVQFIANKEQSGFIKPSEFNLAAQQAQMQLFTERYGHPSEYSLGNPIPVTGGYAQSQKLQDDFNPFMMSDNFSGDIKLNSLSCNYAHLISIHGSNNSRVKLVSLDEYGEMSTSQLVAPSSTYPVAYFSDKMRISVDGITSGKLYYLRYPVDPLWDYYKDSSGKPLNSATGSVVTYPVFDKTSSNNVYNDETGYNCSNNGNPYENCQNFEFPYDCFNEIAIKILSFVGINLREPALTQYTELKEQQGI